MRAFLHFAWRLRVRKNGNLREKWPKVSSLAAQYSRFRETLRGDLFRSALRDRAAYRGLAARNQVRWLSAAGRARRQSRVPDRPQRVRSDEARSMDRRGGAQEPREAIRHRWRGGHSWYRWRS